MKKSTITMATACSSTSTTSIEWDPSALVRPASSSGKQFALIVLNQPLQNHQGVIHTLWDNAAIRIAADGGANCLFDVAGKQGDASLDDLDVIIGDLDSLSPTARSYFENPDPSSPRKPTQVIHDHDQYSTDFGKAVHHVRHNYHHSSSPSQPLDIIAVGGLGGRVDQGLSQLHHLYLFQSSPTYAEGRMYLFSGESLTFLLKAGSHKIRVRSPGQPDVFGKYVGILPTKEPSRITTKGLEWDVADWETEFGGQVSTSNHVLPETEVIEVETTKDVIFTIALRQA
ncbi:thiamine pyrophosphokinase 1 [Podospora australis]|uniref:Thiamine pyrophosphokinase n=1 Tax=Podospora australis TaxID=1536484 RepID=A0AAN6WK21_9PEZI|nr:thiamine pyrophosphokinase 1 [Podospora australis]